MTHPQQFPPHQTSTPQPRNGIGTASLVLGIVGAVLAVVPIVGVIAWPVVLVGLPLGIIGIRRVSKRVATNRGSAIAGTALSAVGLFICIAWLGATGAGIEQAEKDMREAEQQLDAPNAPAPQPAPEPEQSEAGTIAGDGTYLVGADIEPGTYRSSEPTSFACYWARLSGTSGDFNSIIANNTSQGASVVTIEPGDAAFETVGCGTWTLAE